MEENINEESTMMIDIDALIGKNNVDIFSDKRSVVGVDVRNRMTRPKGIRNAQPSWNGEVRRISAYRKTDHRSQYFYCGR